MKDVVIVSACRTAIGAFGGALRDSNAAEMARVTMRESVNRAAIDPALIDDVRYGCCFEPIDAKQFVQQVEEITFSGVHAKENAQNVLYVTGRCVFRLTDRGMMLIEVAPGIDVEKDILGQMDFEPLRAPDLKAMDTRIFQPARMGIDDELAGGGPKGGC